MARRVAIGEVALNILDASLPSEGAPILAKRKSYERKIDEAKQEERDTAALSRARKVVKEQGGKGGFVLGASQGMVLL